MKKFLMLLVLVVAFSANFFGASLLDVMAKEQSEPELHRYYKSIMIEEGDSLWSLAQTYNTKGSLSTQEYISELRSMNRIYDDTIHAGQYINVIYFSEEVK